MAIKPTTIAPPRSLAGQGYAATYLKSKQAVLQERLQYAEQEILNRYKSEVGYRAELKAIYEDTEAELDALRKERQSMDKAAATVEARVRTARTGGGGGSGDDWRTTLFKERTKLAQTIAEESTKVSGQRVDLITKAEGLFVAPVGATDQISRAAATASDSFKVGEGRVLESSIDDFLQNDASLPAAFNGLTEGQKQAASIHLYRTVAGEVVKGKGGQPLTATEEAHIKDGISKRFGIDKADIDDKRLAFAKEAATDDYLKTAGSSLKAMQEQIRYIDEQLKAEGEADKLAAKEALKGADERDFLRKVSPTDVLETLYIEAVSNDGKLTAEEAANLDTVVFANVDKFMLEKGDREGKVKLDGVSYTRDQLINKVRDTYAVDPNRNLLQNLELQYLDDPRMQGYKREGELQMKKASVGSTLEKRYGSVDAPAPVAVPRYEDVQARGAQLYYPERTRRGFGEQAPYMASETARNRRGLEQGVPAGELPNGRQGEPFGAVSGATGIRAPVSNLSTPNPKPGVGQPPYRAANAVFDVTMSVQDNIGENKRFIPRELDKDTATYYDSFSSALSNGSLKPQKLYDEVSRVTSSGLYDDPAAAQKARDDLMFNLVGSSYQKFLDTKASKPQ